MATLQAHQLLNQANQAMERNDLVSLCMLVEDCQANKHTYPKDVVQHVLRCARMLVMMRYGKPRAPKVAGIYRNNKPIKLGRRQAW